MICPTNDCPELLVDCSTIVELLRHRALHQREQSAFTFLPEVETDAASWTYYELDRRSRAIASQLQVLGLRGERALLLYPPGLDYLAAFFGCLYAGVVAVPAYPPRNQRNAPRIVAIAKDAMAAIVLTTTAILPKVRSLLVQPGNELRWLTTDNLEGGIEDGWEELFIEKDTLAFLQYTSGSTGTPKGVMLSHGNLLHNAAMTYRLMEHSAESKFVSWLPTYHDMGLIGGILQPLYGGFPCILMSPASFLQSPYRWLQAISHYKGTTSGGPNFAYELCIQKITAAQRQTLDLSSWSVAFNGAETVRHDTLERFAATFADCGFRQEAFYPCYGMAEATLMVSGGIKAAKPIIKTVKASGLESDRIVSTNVEPDMRSLVSCGQIAEQQIAIVHPEKLTRCQPDEVGEIWVSGPSIGQGYWNRIAETEQTFRAYLSDEGPFLRTGDLGFLDNGELFITGRAKDLIIIRGRNLYPQDIELTAERSHPKLRLGSGAAFSVEVENEEKLVVVQELEFRVKPSIGEVAAAIRQAVVEEHEVQVYAVVLIKAGSIPKTSSGKIQRRATRAKFLAGELDVIETSILDNFYEFQQQDNHLSRQNLLAIEPEQRQHLLETYLQQQLARSLKVDPGKLDSQQSLNLLGIDSIMAVELKNGIESLWGVEISIVKLLEAPSIAELAMQISEQLAIAKPVVTAIPRVATNNGEYPLSFAQQRLWFFDQLEPGNPFYNIPAAVEIKGTLNIAVLEQSLNAIAQRHAALRTTFMARDGKPFQAIAPTLSLTLPVVDLEKLPKTEQETTVQRLIKEEARQPFDLKSGSLLRCTLLRICQTEYIMLLTIHHIAADGWSMGVFLRELAAFYEGKSASVPPLAIQYADFAVWERAQQEIFNAQLAYWKQQLKKPLPVLELPADRPRPPVQSFAGKKQLFELSESLTQELKALSRREKVTLFMTLLAAFKLLLYRYSGQQDILVGSPVANRDRQELEPLIGCFVNTLVLRTNLSDNLTFRELLGRVREVALGAYANQNLPFDQLVEEIQPERDLSRNPLIQVWFALHNAPMPPLEMLGLSLTRLTVDTGTVQLDLSLDMEETSQGLIGWIEYSTDLFDAATITRTIGHFKTLLESIVERPDQRLKDISILTAAERQQLLNQAKICISRWDKRCIHQLFEAQVEQTPDIPAVIFETEEITYRQLNERANQLAHYLQKLGVKPEVLVGVCLERSVETIVGILAILKAGGACVPLDPTYPKERLAFMLEDSQVAVLLTQKRGIKLHASSIVCLDSDWEAISEESSLNPVSGVMVSNLAYVLYTSGSTGKSKGVCCHHLGVTNLLADFQSRQPINAGDGCSLWTSLNFDVSVYEIFSALLAGGTLHIVPETIRSDGKKFVEWLNDRQICSAYVPPFQVKALSDWLEQSSQKLALQRLLVGVEPIPEHLLISIKKQVPGLEIINGYGPTETTICATLYSVASENLNDRKTPIGRAVQNTDIYLLDSNLQMVPMGIPGEVYIGGAGLARGYLNRGDLTAEMFVPHPFSNQPGERLYKTGDRARYLADGNIEFLGRLDSQIKLRGFRIELGEIEAVLKQHPLVQDAIVLVEEDAERLVAYVVNQQKPSNKSMPEMGTEVQYLSQIQTVYDQFYSWEFSQVDPSINLRVWTNSYTDLPFPEAEILECVENTVSRIVALQQGRVLEIGCGTGLLLKRIAPECDRYWGMDISSVALGYLQEQLTTHQPEVLFKVKLLQGMAHDLQGLETAAIDTVILNEIVQNFPSIEYLVNVLENVVNVVKPGGCIFIGGVRSLPLLEAFHASVQVHRASDFLTKAQLKQRVEEHCNSDNELVIDPAFFTALKQHLPKISDVQIQLKGGRYHNELTRFKYDAILYVNSEVKTTGELQWLDWQELKLNVAAVRNLLADRKFKSLGIRQVPNARLLNEIRVLEWLEAEEKSETVGELRSLLQTNQNLGVDPEDLWALSRELPYSVEINWSGAVGCYDVVFRERLPEEEFALTKTGTGEWVSPIKVGIRPWSEYANKRFQEEVFHKIVPQLRGFLKEKLPEYMMPGGFVILDSLPLLPNGKVDRRSLPKLDNSRLDLGVAYVAPQTQEEHAIATVWKETLQLEKVGIHDNFFDLGGNSLLIVQAHSKLREVLGRELSVVDLFQHPTIGALSRHLSQEQNEQPAFDSIQNRAKKQQQALTRQKQLMNRKERNS